MFKQPQTHPSCLDKIIAVNVLICTCPRLRTVLTCLKRCVIWQEVEGIKPSDRGLSLSFNVSKCDSTGCSWEHLRTIYSNVGGEITGCFSWDIRTSAAILSQNMMFFQVVVVPKPNHHISAALWQMKKISKKVKTFIFATQRNLKVRPYPNITILNILR